MPVNNSLVVETKYKSIVECCRHKKIEAVRNMYYSGKFAVQLNDSSMSALFYCPVHFSDQLKLKSTSNTIFFNQYLALAPKIYLI